MTVEGLTRRFGGHTVLDEVTFSLAEGEAVAVVGPNGAGKSTLLRCVGGLDIPDEGEIRFLGRPMNESDPEVRAALAMVFDDLDFFPDLTVREHMELFARAHGNADPDDLIDEVIDEVGLTHAADQLPVTLSSGQSRRAMLGSFLVRPHRLVMLDEPEQRLDVAGREWLASTLIRRKSRGTALLFASHDERLVSTVADRTIEVSS